MVGINELRGQKPYLAKDLSYSQSAPVDLC